MASFGYQSVLGYLYHKDCLSTESLLDDDDDGGGGTVCHHPPGMRRRW